MTTSTRNISYSVNSVPVGSFQIVDELVVVDSNLRNLRINIFIIDLLYEVDSYII